MSHESYKNNEIFVDEVMRECWKHKEELAAKYPTWEAYSAHLIEDRKRLESEGWKFASPADLPPPPQLPLEFVTKDKDFLRNYDVQEMALSDFTTGVNTAVEKKQIEIAKNLLTEGLSKELIQKTTGLDMETIQSLV